MKKIIKPFIFITVLLSTLLMCPVIWYMTVNTTIFQLPYAILYPVFGYILFRGVKILYHHNAWFCSPGITLLLGIWFSVFILIALCSYVHADALKDLYILEELKKSVEQAARNDTDPSKKDLLLKDNATAYVGWYLECLVHAWTGLVLPPGLLLYYAYGYMTKAQIEAILSAARTKFPWYRPIGIPGEFHTCTYHQWMDDCPRIFLKYVIIALGAIFLTFTALGISYIAYVNFNKSPKCPPSPTPSQRAREQAEMDAIDAFFNRIKKERSGGNPMYESDKILTLDDLTPEQFDQLQEILEQIRNSFGA